jgi:hypothetical protein
MGCWNTPGHHYCRKCVAQNIVEEEKQQEDMAEKLPSFECTYPGCIVDFDSPCKICGGDFCIRHAASHGCAIPAETMQSNMIEFLNAGSIVGDTIHKTQKQQRLQEEQEQEAQEEQWLQEEQAHCMCIA